MIIDNSYFQSKQTFIPNVIAQPNMQSNTPSEVNQLQMEIDSREYELLVSFLGVTQTEELLSQFETNGDWKVDALQKWKDLVDGLDDWKGLRYTVGAKKVSLIAYYVFYYYLSDIYSTLNTTGVQIAESQNATTVSPTQKQVNAWNNFVEMYNGFCNGTDYRFFNNWNGIALQWNQNNNGNKTTLYDFMQSKPTDYDSSFFTFQTVINTFGL